MVALGEEMVGVDATVVTFMQTIRLISVVFLVPFLTLNELAGKASSSTVPISVGDWKGYALFTLIAVGGAFLGQRIHLPVAFLTGSLLATAIAVVFGFASPTSPFLADYRLANLYWYIFWVIDEAGILLMTLNAWVF